MPLTNEKVLIHLPLEEPKGWIAKVQARFPDLRIHWSESTVVAGGLSPLDDLPRDLLDGVNIMCLFPPPRPENMKDVRFVQLVSAGSDRWVNHPKFLDPDVTFCSGSGIHAPQIAEWVIGTWLSNVHSLHRYALLQQEEEWAPLRDMSKFGTDSVGRRIGIAGYGAIGRSVAQIAQAMGMEVYVYTQRPKTTPESRVSSSTYRVPGTGDPNGTIPARWFNGDFDEFISQDLDLLVLALPLYDSTRGLLSTKQFEILGRGSKKTFVSNVARGPIIDTPALIGALEAGLVAGAALDVTDPEPLPKGHPLWKAPNLFISPHVSWQSKSVFVRATDLLFENLQRMDRGEPLLNDIKGK